MKMYKKWLAIFLEATKVSNLSEQHKVALKLINMQRLALSYDHCL